MLASTSRSDVTCEATSVMFFCAPSMTARRSLQLGEVRHRVLGLRCIDWPMRWVDGIEPLGDRARELRLPARQHLAHRLHAAGGLGLDARDLGHALFEFAGVDARGGLPRRRASARSRASMMALRRSRREGGTAEPRRASLAVMAVPPITEKRLVHRALSSKPIRVSNEQNKNITADRVSGQR